MSEQNRYTAQEMREAADTMDESIKEIESGISLFWKDDHITHEDWKAMLRQAAETRERLDAVMKVAKEQFDVIFHSPMCWDEDENESHSLEQLKEMDALEMVMATARGDAVKEEK